MLVYLIPHVFFKPWKTFYILHVFNNFYILHRPKYLLLPLSTPLKYNVLQSFFSSSLSEVDLHESSITGNAKEIFGISMGIERQGQVGLGNCKDRLFLLNFAINGQYFEADVGSRHCFLKMVWSNGTLHSDEQDTVEGGKLMMRERMGELRSNVLE